MIRINLLEAPKPKSKRSMTSALPSIDVGDVGSPRTKILVIVGLAAVLNLGYWYRLDAQKKSIEKQMGRPSRRTGNWLT